MVGFNKISKRAIVVPIVVTLNVALARRKMRSRDLAKRIGISEANLSLLKSCKVKQIRFETMDRLCEALDCQPRELLEYHL